MTIPIPIYATSLSSLEGIFYTITKASIYAAPMFPQECAPHFLVSIFHPTLFPHQEVDCSLCIHAVLVRLFYTSISIPDCRLYYCCYLFVVQVQLFRRAPGQLSVTAGCHTDLNAQVWTPGYGTCGVTKSSVSEAEQAWSADAREVFEPCSTTDEVVALQGEKTDKVSKIKCKCLVSLKLTPSACPIKPQ